MSDCAAACAALFEKDGRVLAEEVERGFGGELFAFEGEDDDGAGRLGERHGRGGTEDHHGFSAGGNGRWTLGLRRFELARWDAGGEDEEG